jgi:cysteine desulfurase/selenocysteine lyase
MSPKDDFPIFSAHPELVYLDSGATSQKPKRVIDRLSRFFSSENANIHRGIYALAEQATVAYEKAREKAQVFLGARKPQEIVVTTGTTYGINLLAYGLAQTHLKPGDEILIPITEHHSNIVPWQMAAQRTGAVVRAIPLGPDLCLDLEAYGALLSPRTKILALAHVSNVLGTIHPVQTMARMAHEVGALVICDGAQGAAHLPCNVQDLDVDFYTVSGHKICGPTGVGVLYGRHEVLENIPPFLGGGDMIRRVSMDGFTTADLPARLEAGTPPIGQMIALGEAMDYLSGLDRGQILAHEQALGEQVLAGLAAYPWIRCHTPQDRTNWVGIVSFTNEKIHPHDLAAFLDTLHIAIRAGHHCAEPLMGALGTKATCRVSPFLYNDGKDIDLFLEGMEKARIFFQ